jgi:hypothetical protein
VEALDDALIDRIWFHEVAFSRESGAERKPEGSAPAAGATKDGRAGARPDEGAVRVEQRAEIRGMAGSHALLGEFIMRLGARPGIGQVKLVDSGAKSYPGVQVVEFRLALTLSPTGSAAR